MSHDDEQARHDLGRALHRKVDRMHDAPLGLDDVRGRAGRIRRRRRTAIGAGIVAAVVVIVPAAIATTGRLDRSDDRLTTASATPGATPSATSGATPSATPSARPGASATTATESAPTDTATSAPRSAPFDVSGLPTGPPPAIEWSDGRDLHRADGSVLAGVLPPGTDGFAPMGSGWVVTSRDDQGNASAQWVPESGVSTSPVYDLDGSLATSPEGEVVAWAEPDGGVRVVQGDGDEVHEMPPLTAPGAYDAVAVGGEDCKEGRTSDAGCAVFVNTLGAQAGSWMTTSHGIADRYDEEIEHLTAWTEGVYAGITAFHDDLTTCSAVREPDTLSTIWDTCDHRLVEFSPDGGHLLAVGSIGDGFGDGQVALLDASDGRVRADLRSDEQHQTAAVQMTWEDDSHALLVTYAGGEWAVVRLGLDGSLEYAVPPRPGSDAERPFFLQS